MIIAVNGRDMDVASGTTVSILIEGLGIEIGRIAVEVNKEIVPRRRHAEHVLAAGDRVEVVTMVGGG